MFGGEKRRKRLQQIRDALQQGLNLGDLVGPQNPAGGQQYGPGQMAQYGPGQMAQYGPGQMAQYGPGQMAQYGPGQMGQFNSIIESVIERQIAKNPALAGNPAIAARMNELIQAAKQDPQGFQQRMQQLAESGVTPESVTPDQIAQLIGPAPGALPGSPGTLPGSPLPPSPPQGNPFGGQQGGG
jgi:hypothetical protein